MTTALESTHVADITGRFVAWLETGEVPPGLFAPDVFVDLTSPTWRQQAEGVADLVALRRDGRPSSGRVPRHRVDLTPTGFVREWEEIWRDGGQEWYCREMCRAEVSQDGITDISVYCTGDWDEARRAEHASAFELIRP